MNSLEAMVFLMFGIWIAGSLLSLFVQYSKPTSHFLNILPSLLALLISINITWLSNQTGLEVIGWDWFTLGNTSISLTFEFNRFTVPLMIAVNAISFLVHVYSIAYMKNDAARPRFFATLALFTFSMLGLTLSGNLLQLFMFWELVGLCSYLLIGFYRAKPEAAQAATKALVINKIGDVCFLVALMMLWAVAGGLNIESLSSTEITAEWRTLIGTALSIAVLAKSAQFPFHTWLPDAMAGPTPVSALIHSATMVAAGVFLLVRLQFLFTPFTLQLITILGALTALIGALNAIRENDLKRFLAWSTLSQLGLMVMIAGGSGFHASFMHLLSHAIFKAGLFLAIGILINHYHIKSFTEKVNTPTTILRVLVFVLTLALMGMPLTIGFLSKELMLGAVQSPIIAVGVLTLSFITAFYSARLLMFIKPAKSESFAKIPTAMYLPVFVLAVASLWIFYSWSPWSAKAIADTFQLTEPSFNITMLSIGLILSGMFVGIILIRQNKLNIIQKLIPVVPYDNWIKFVFLQPVFTLCEVTTQIDIQIDRGIHLLAYAKVALAHVIAWIDQNIIDGLVHTFGWIAKALGNLFRKLVTGRIQDYIWWTVAALILILIITLN